MCAMTASDTAARADFLLTLVREAGQMAHAAFLSRPAGQFSLKGPQDPVTEADRAVEAFLRASIAQAFPGDGFLGEESGSDGLPGSEGVWVVDPIDGTDNFARGIAHFCVAIAWISAGKVQLGAIYNPVSDELYHATRGGSALKNGVAISVSQTPAMGAAAIELGWSPRIARDDYLQTLVRLLDSGANVRRSGSGALGLAWVAEGRIDGYAELHMNAWDSMAGLLLVKEAGGTISTPTSFGQGLHAGGLVYASNRAIAPSLLNALAIESAV